MSPDSTRKPNSVYVKVRPGVTYGAYGEHKPGFGLYVTRGELEAFPDKLMKVNPPSDVAPGNATPDSLVHVSWHGESLPDISRYSVYSVLEFVKHKLITVNDAVAMERKRIPPRRTLIEQLMLLDVNGD